MAPEGQAAMHVPELAERGAVQRVQCVAELRHSAQSEEQPGCELTALSLEAEQLTHADMFLSHSAAHQEAGTTLPCTSARTGRPARDTHLRTRCIAAS
jgi:hypothetical protein